VSNNPVVKLNEAYHEFLDGKIDRRGLMTRATALGLSAASVSMFMRGVPAGAQDASPVASPAASPAADLSFQSITFQDFKAQLAQDFPMEEPASTGGIVIMGEIATSTLTTTNMMLSNNNPTNPILALVYETLVGTNPTDGQYVPLLAERWEIAPDGRTYTFFLQQNVTWHDGTPFTADDVVFSMEAQADPATGSSYTGSFNATVESFSKVDDYTVQVVATDVFAQVVFHGNSYCPIVAKHIWEGVAHDQWVNDPGSTGADASRVVGTGPFKFQELNASEATATFVKNEGYWDQVPNIDTFIFQPWPDEVSAIEALRAGDVDFYENVPPADVEGLQAEESLEVALYDTYSFGFFGFNLDPAKTGLFQDVRVRQALMWGIDRQSIVDNINLGYGEVATGTQPVLSPAYAPDRLNTIYTYDPDKAMALLDEAGVVDSDGDGVREFNGEPFAFEVMYGSGAITNDQTVAYLQDAWSQIGVQMTPNPVDFDTVLVPAITENFNYQVALLGFNWDPTGDQSAMFHSNATGGAGFNFMTYINPELDALIDQASRTIDEQQRVELLIEINNILNEELPVVVISFRKDRTAYNVRMHNFTPNAPGGLLWSLPYVWVEQ
jgi:peptide/nickel transport system substrate-binding protein